MKYRDQINSALRVFEAKAESVRLSLKAIGSMLYLHRKRIAAIVTFLVSTSTALVGIELLSTYTHYAAIIDSRLQEGILRQPSGIYAAPRQLGVGKRISQKDLIQHLLRAGYLQGAQASEFSVGNFIVNSGGVEVHTAGFAQANTLPAELQINFSKDGIGELIAVESGKELNQVSLPAEMLTADFSAREQTRRALRFDEIPEVLINAICAIEDREFFSHHGVDFAAIVRAAIKNYRHGAILEGGSTITQQLVKNEFLTPEKTYQRKFTEALMAIALERRLTKQEIMTLYCERVYLGHSGPTTVYGFRQAAKIYFGKELRDLDVSEAAFLAGIVKAPNRYSAHNRLEEALARRNVVLEAMTKAGFITAEAASASKAEQLAILPPQKLDDSAAPHFIDYVHRQIAKLQFDEEDQPNLWVETTIDLDLQQAANQTVANHLNRISKMISRRKRDKQHQPEAALVAIDPQSGAILAMVGGRDYAVSQLNRASDALRQPGSVFKPIVYATALSRGISPATTFENSPHDIEFGYKAVYRPQNFGKSYSNQPVTLREALVRSLNVITVDAAMQAGLGNVATMAENMGLPRPEAYPSMALGAFEATPLEIARAYTTFANSGMRVDPLAIRTVRQNGFEVYNGTASKAGVLSATTAYLVTDALADVVNRGTAARIRRMGYKGPVAGKTGTSRDAWFVGYTPKLLVAVWIGFDDNTDLRLTGGEAAAPIWADFVKRALELRPDLVAKQFHKPGGLEEVEIDPETGMLADEFCPHRQRMLIATFLSPGVCFEHQAPVEALNADLPISDSSEIESLDFTLNVALPVITQESVTLPKTTEPETPMPESKQDRRMSPVPPH